MKFNKLAFLAATAGVLALGACQTTRDYSFSEWQEMPVGKSRFNVPSVSSVPVTKLEQNDRNNGQVQNEKWQLACGQGYVSLEYTHNVWFTQGVEDRLQDQAEFVSHFEERKISVSNLKAVSNENGRAVGYMADAKLTDGTNCKAAMFGFRASAGSKGYNNDLGGIDTVANAIYCGSEPFNMERLTSEISLVEDREAYARNARTLPKMTCKNQLNDTPMAKMTINKVVAASIEWPDFTKETTADIWLRRNETQGKFDVSLADKNCTGTFSANEAQKDKGIWELSCDSGINASGDFEIDNTRKMTMHGTDHDGGAITIQMPI